MKRVMMMLGALSLLLCGVGQVQAGPVGYDLQVTTMYQFGAPSNSVGYSGAPDTSFYQITNNGSSTFHGTIGDVAVSQFSGDYSYSTSGITLAPGQSSVWFGTSPESSNVGGFNGTYGTVQPGIQVNLTGTISQGLNSESVNLSVNDSQIHSGVFRTNPYGVTLDNYVLQGGDPYGRDTADAYETTQANGHYTFFEQGMSLTPEPSSLVLLGMTSSSLAGYFGWRRRKQVVA